MIQGKNFNFDRIINDVELTDKKIDLNSKNMLKMKSIFKSCITVGFVLGIIFVLFFSISILFDRSSDWFLYLVGIFVVAFLFGTLLAYFTLVQTMDLSSYKKLIQFSKKQHEVYKYFMDIKSIYSPRVTPIAPSADDGNYNEQMTRHKYGMAQGTVLLVDNQKVYLLDNEIMFDKKIILYIAKCNDEYVLYDYERISE